jgi:membrane-bound serine protease (ClpP class)
VLASIGVVLMLVALGICYNVYGLNWTAAVLTTEAALGVGVGYAAIKFFPRTKAGGKMILSEMQTDVRAATRHADELIGREGVAHTFLRPAGTAMVDGKRLDVVAESGMIERGSPVRIVAVQENRIVVRKV